MPKKKRRTNVPGTIYVLHFDRPYHHAQHYVGWTEDVAARFDRHSAGHGSPLVKAAIAAGIGVQISLVRPGTRADERKLHNAGKTASRLCPLCRRPQKRKSTSVKLHVVRDDKYTKCGRLKKDVARVTMLIAARTPDVCKQCLS